MGILLLKSVLAINVFTKGKMSYILVMLLVVLSGCSSQYIVNIPAEYPQTEESARIPLKIPQNNAVRGVEKGGATPHGSNLALADNGQAYKIGNPYTIDGRTYKPQENYKYKERGIASWYGPQFHGKKTANGGRFDMNVVSAAHRTLPLPSIVKVTNLENKRSLVIKVNDRGPYSKNRIIDISKRGAEILGYKNNGTTLVEIQILENESRALAAYMKNERKATAFKFTNNTKIYTINNSLKNTAAKQKTIVSNGKIYIQVGVYNNYKNVLKIKKKLNRFGNISIRQLRLKSGKQGYVLLMGEYPSIAEADKTAIQIHKQGFLNSFVKVE